MAANGAIVHSSAVSQDGAAGVWNAVSCSSSDGSEFIQCKSQRLSSSASKFSVRIVAMADGGEKADGPRADLVVGLCGAAAASGGGGGGGGLWRSSSMCFQTTSGTVYKGVKVLKRTRVQCVVGDVIMFKATRNGNDQLICGIHHNGKLLLQSRYSAKACFATVGFTGGLVKVDVHWPTESEGAATVDKSKEIERAYKNEESWMGSDAISSKDGLFTLTKGNKSPKAAFTVQRQAALIPDVRKNEHSNAYLEVQVKPGTGGSTCIGLGDVVFDPNLLPGDDPGSIGYCSDGTIKSSQQILKAGVSYKVGDRVGVGIVYLESYPDSPSQYLEVNLVVVYFTKNGERIFTETVPLPSGGFFPAIGIKKEGGSLQLTKSPALPAITDEDMASFREAARLRSMFQFSSKVTLQTHSSMTAPDSVGIPRLVQRIAEPLEANAFFRVKIIAIDAGGCVSVGVATKKMPQDGYRLGIAPNSCGYHSKDGSLNGFGEKYFATPMGQGASIGVWLQYFAKKRVIVAFTNDANKVIGKTELRLPADDDVLYPSLTLEGATCKVTVEWPTLVKPKPDLVFATPVSLLRDLATWLCFSGVRPTATSTLKLFTKSAASGDSYVGAQSPAPLSRHGMTYFEVKVNSFKPDFPIFVGFAPAVVSLRMPVGSDVNSFGVDVVTGHFTSGKIVGKLDTTWSPAERLGLGVSFQTDVAPGDLSEQNVTVYVTKNGKVVLQTPFKMAHGGLFPMVSLNGLDDSVEFDFNAAAPKMAAVGSSEEASVKDSGSSVDTLQSPFTDDDDDDDNDDDLIHGDNDANDKRPCVFVAHADSGLALAKSLKKQATGKFRVSTSAELVRMEQKMVAISKANVHVVVITKDALTGDGDDDLYQEFLLIKGQGNTLVVLRSADTAWPPDGDLAGFEHFFKEREKEELVLKVEKTVKDQFWTQLNGKVERVVALKMARSEQKEKESERGSGRGIFSLYEDEHSAGGQAVASTSGGQAAKDGGQPATKPAKSSCCVLM